MYGTILQQGNFVSTGNDYTLKIRSDVDFMHVYNWTRTNAGIVAATGIEWYWQRNMPVDDGIVKGWSVAGGNPWLVATCQGLLSGGFTLVNSSTVLPSAGVVVTVMTNVPSPVVTTALPGVSVGSIVRVYGTAQTDVNGLDFSVGAIVAGVSLTMRSALQQAPGVAGVPGIAGAAVEARLIASNVDEYNRIYPSKRVICNVTQAAVPTVTTLVDHSLTVGQQVRVNIPAICGMTELNGQIATVVAVTAVNTFTIDIDTTGYTAFVYPTVAQVGPNGAWTQPEIVPLGGFAGTFTGQLPGYTNQSIVAATTDNDFIGIKLSAFNTGAIFWAPAGTVGNDIYWVAGKSVNI